MRACRLLMGVMLLALTPGLRARAADGLQGVWIEVRDATSSQPVPGARIRALLDSAYRGVTDSTGIVEMALRGDLRLPVTSRVGFRPDTSTISAEAWAACVWVVRLSPNAQRLAEVAIRNVSPTISLMTQEFETRRARQGGGASFIGPEVFEKSHTGPDASRTHQGVARSRWHPHGALCVADLRGRCAEGVGIRPCPPGVA